METNENEVNKSTLIISRTSRGSPYRGKPRTVLAFGVCSQDNILQSEDVKVYMYIAVLLSPLRLTACPLAVPTANFSFGWSETCLMLKILGMYSFEMKRKLQPSKNVKLDIFWNGFPFLSFLPITKLQKSIS